LNEQDLNEQEHLDTAGCCECGSKKHVCQDCPTFTAIEQTQVVIIFGTATQSPWLTVVREFVFQKEVVFAELLFSLGGRRQ